MGIFSWSGSKPKNVVEADTSRLEIKGSLSKSDAEWIRDHKTAKVVQLHGPVNGKTFAKQAQLAGCKDHVAK